MRPIFDSLTHPTLSGEFLGRPCSFQKLSVDLQRCGIRRACAVGIPGTGGYEHGRYWDECRKFPVFFPVAGLDSKVKNPLKEILQVRSLGYKAIKIHPRLCGWDASSPQFSDILSIATRERLIVFFCTYSAGKIQQMPSADPYWSLVNALKKTPDVRMVLAHGGGTEILRYADLVRANPNLLLDVSFTLMKYRGSSLDLDMRFLSERLDQRICAGSDAPDYSPADFSKQLSRILRGLSAEKQNNIAGANLASFLEKT